ncbi:MAG: MopE-related protein, partial [Flavobacteriales bacterium]
MKRLLFVLSLSAWSILSFSQHIDGVTEVVTASHFAVTRPLTEIAKDFPVPDEGLDKPKKLYISEDKKNRTPQQFPYTVADGPEYGNDPKSMQTFGGADPKGQMKVNWQGQTASGFRPYDPSGAAGPSHYVQMINSTTFKVYDKVTGTVLLTQTLGNLWTPATANAGDPIVMYDKAADRWFLAQFGSGNNNIYIAISQTGNPMGAYYTYIFTSPSFPDYLKFSVWSDGYYMTSNQSPQRVFAFERTAMLAGSPTAKSINTTFSPPTGGGFFCPLPGDAGDGTLPPAGTPCPILSYTDNGWGGGNIDGIRIYNYAVNWVPATPTGSVTLVTTIPTAAFDASYNASWNDCDQPGTTQKLDGIGGVLMYRAQWKSWGTHNSIVLNWGVRISATQRSVKWAEIRQDVSTSVWSLFQEGIYTPDADTRWMGSISMDNNGSIGLAYIKSNSSSIFPGLYWTGRRTCDPLGTLPLTETTIAAGTGFQTGTNRVGDYAHMCLDPDGTTFWCTGEYMGGTSGSSAARTRIFSFTIDGCTTDAGVTIAVTAGSNPTCAGSNITFTALPVNGGTTPAYQWKVNGANVGTNSPTYSSSSLTAGQVVTCEMTSNLPGVTNNPATSNAITIVVSPPVTPSVSIALTSGSNPTCPGAQLTFTATPTNGGTTPAYQWQVNGGNVGTNSSTYVTSSLTNGQIVTCILTTNALCATTSTATSNGITVTVLSNPTPSVTIAQTAGSNPSCAGSSTTFTATVTNGNSPTYQWKVNGANVGTNSPTYTTSSLTNGQSVTCDVTSAPTCPTIAQLGTGSTLNATTSDLAACYPTYYGNGRQQYLIRASELQALGLSAGNITSVGFIINGTVGDPATMNGYTIKMAQTASTVMTTTFLTPTFTTVFGPVNYTPTVNTTNTHTFGTPFVWDGTSNVVMDICFSNQVLGVTAYQCYRTTSTFVSTAYYQQDYAAGAGACTQATGGATGSIRPNMIFAVGGANSVVSSNSITMTVNPVVTPSVSIALTSGANPTCAGQSVGFTATPTNGGTTPGYQWKVNGSNVGTNSPTYSTTTLANGNVVTCVLTSNATCASPTTATSNGITMTVNPIVTPLANIAIAIGSNPTCVGSAVSFAVTVSGGGSNPSYQWLVNGSPVGTNSSIYNTSSLTNGQMVSCSVTSNAPCATPTIVVSNTITMTVNTPQTYYQDNDGDNYGNNAVTQSSCSAVAGYVTTGGDCNDGNAAVNPGATENLCNNIDDNCNGTIDEGRVNGCTNPAACNYNAAATCDDGSCTFAITWYLDADADGYYISTQSSCTSPGAGWTSILPTGGSSDCNDNNAAVNAGATEVLNGIDDDCDGDIDEGFGAGPVADFIADPSTTICTGQSLDFFDLSTGAPTIWSWSFPGGIPSSSSDQNPSVDYLTAGTYTVTLTVTNAFGTDSETKTNYITVNASSNWYQDLDSDNYGNNA